MNKQEEIVKSLKHYLPTKLHNNAYYLAATAAQQICEDESESNGKITIELTEGQVNSVGHLIDNEIQANGDRNDHAYNYYWFRIKESLAKAKTSSIRKSC